LPTTKGVHADIYLSGATNGRMCAASGSVEGALGGKLSGLAWRAQGTLRQAGNFKTPEYYLINTGLKETDYALTLGYKRKRWSTSVYYSMFTTKLGIFLGAESGNDSELVRKFKQGRPELPSFFTYSIGRPYQGVEHQLVKGTATYKFANGATIDAIIARQRDLRNEYDAEPLIVTTNPAARTRPQLSFELTTHSWELVFTQPSKKGWSGSLGTNGTSSGNVFRGARYLIPNYRDYNAGLYAIQCYHHGRWNYEAGLRYDYRWLRVYQRNATTLALYNTTYTYHNFTGTLGASYYANEHLKLTANSGMAWRAPSINEMYVNGQHFSAARFEIGDSTLKTEKAINNNFEVH
jgi:iron complex outermembrane recepter protein